MTNLLSKKQSNIKSNTKYTEKLIVAYFSVRLLENQNVIEMNAMLNTTEKYLIHILRYSTFLQRYPIKHSCRM